MLYKGYKKVTYELTCIYITFYSHKMKCLFDLLQKVWTIFSRNQEERNFFKPSEMTCSKVYHTKKYRHCLKISPNRCMAICYSRCMYKSLGTCVRWLAIYEENNILHENRDFILYANNTDPDQTVHLHCLVCLC